MNSDSRKSSQKKIIIIVASLILLVGAIFGGYVVYKKSPTRSLTPAESKQLVADYLEKKSGQSEFKSALDVSKEKRPWDVLKVQYDAPPDYKTVYRRIGEHLFIADQLIQSAETREMENGFKIVTELCDVAEDVAVDGWLAARICDAYIVPNLSKVEENPKRGMSRDQLMQMAARIYYKAGDNDKAIELCKIYIAQAKSNSRADAARWRLGSLLENKGDHKEALKYYREITDPDAKPKIAKHIARLEQRTGTKPSGN